MKKKAFNFISLALTLAILVSSFVVSGAFYGASNEKALQPESAVEQQVSSVMPSESSDFIGVAQVETSIIDTIPSDDLAEGSIGSVDQETPKNDLDVSGKDQVTEIIPPTLPEEEEYAPSTYKMTGFKEIYFDEMFPDYLTGDTSWDPLGIDDNGIVYFGYTGRRLDLGVEDFSVFSYNPEKDVVKFLGSFIESSKAANNYVDGESIPKGHTKFYCIDNMMYMASQGFHDFKGSIDDYQTYRGAHLYAYDIEKEVLIDVSANMPDGVWCKHEGVVSMNYVEEIGKLVGFTHPLANLVFYDLETGTVDRFVEGIPWSLGNPLSRELIVSGDRIYFYRGVEDTWRVDEQYPVYYYDYGDDEVVKTDQYMGGGFWNGQETTSDGKTAYISGCCSYLYKMDLETGKVTFLRDMDLDGHDDLGFTYSISMSPDETKIFYVPVARTPGYIYEYDIATNSVRTVATSENAIYCGSSIVTKDNWYYFTRFGTGGAWEGKPSLVAFKLEPWVTEE